MRFEGTLTKWNDDRGFGFITPEPAGQEIFVHISAFARDGLRPQLNETLSFEITLNKDGKKQATAVRRSGANAPVERRHSRADAQRRHRPARSEPRSLSMRGVVMVIACALLAAAYWQFDRRTHNTRAQQAQALADAPAPRPATPRPSSAPQAASAYRCDGRQHCSQMNSCAEATFFLKNCPGVKMDGNGDGVPCEQQWCTGPLGN